MAFNKITYVPGDVLTAEQMNEIQDAIETNKGNIEPHITNKKNPHGVTAEQVGARPNTWLPTPAEIGAVSRAEWEASLLVLATLEPKGV